MATKTLESPARPHSSRAPEVSALLQAPTATPMVTDHRPRSPASTRPSTAPAGGLAFVCPHCGRGHFGRAREEAGITGRRRARCGRLVIVLAARTYRGQR